MRTCLRLGSRVAADRWEQTVLELARAGVKELPARPRFVHELESGAPGAQASPSSPPQAQQADLEALAARVEARSIRFERATLEGLRAVLGEDRVLTR